MPGGRASRPASGEGNAGTTSGTWIQTLFSFGERKDELLRAERRRRLEPADLDVWPYHTPIADCSGIITHPLLSSYSMLQRGMARAESRGPSLWFWHSTRLLLLSAPNAVVSCVLSKSWQFFWRFRLPRQHRTWEGSRGVACKASPAAGVGGGEGWGLGRGEAAHVPGRRVRHRCERCVPYLSVPYFGRGALPAWRMSLFAVCPNCLTPGHFGVPSWILSCHSSGIVGEVERGV
jgi:hypothetical protein